MIYKGVSKSEIENSIEGKGNFIKIDYLNRYLNQNLSIDIKKFVYLKLADIYEEMKLFGDAAKMFDSAAVISLTFSEKIKYYVKETEKFIQSGDFRKSDEALKKAMNQGNIIEKEKIYENIKNFYKQLAQEYENILNRNKASKIYEKLLEMKINDLERKEIKGKLIQLYDKLGKRYLL